MDECPTCKRWTLSYDPRSEIQKCSNCGYEKHVKYDDYVKENNMINDLFYPSKTKRFFYFSSPSGNLTGESILFLEELAEKIKKVDVKTIEFHFYRRDFEKWIADTSNNEKVAKAISDLHDKNLHGETLRSDLYDVIVSNLKK
jgi:hypothetical protein